MSSSIYNYEKFFELTPDFLCISGFDGYFKKVNAAVSNTLGYSQEELYAQPINFFIHPDDVEMTNKARASLTESDTLYNFENRYLTKSGEIVWLTWTSQPSAEDQVIFAIAKNITHKKHLELVKDGEFTKLVKLNDTYKQLSYTTSHDLRSPLDSLLSAFNLLDVNTIQDTKTLELIHALKRGGEKLKTRVDNYINDLNIANDYNIKIETVCLSEVLKVVLTSLSSLIQNTNILIKSNFTKFDHIIFNQARMESIFLNLISNAIKFRSDNTLPCLSIYTEIFQDSKKLVFEDNGLGFDIEKNKERIFKLNQTFHHNADSKGIGLYLVKKHLENLGGEIEVESEPGKGAKFIITFNEDNLSQTH